LAKVDVDRTRPVRADRGEEILGFEAMGDVVKFFAIAGEEDGASSGPVADADYVALDVFGTVICRGEGLVEAAMAA
jgi:hypothetical protein